MISLKNRGNPGRHVLIAEPIGFRLARESFVDNSEAFSAMNNKNVHQIEDGRQKTPSERWLVKMARPSRMSSV